jgi:phenylalanyl-tRNA synthetase beta subunit
MTRTFTNKGDVEVSYPVASDKGYLRTSLYEGVQSSVNLAIKNAPLLQIDEVKVFEIGKIFTKQGEKNSLLVYIKNIKKKQEKEKEKIKVLRDELINELNIKANILCSIDDTGGIITVNGVTVGFTNKVEGVMEIDLDLLVKNINKKLDLNSIEMKEGSRVKFKQFSVYPFITRDIALFVSKQDDTESVKSGIYSVIKKEAGEILVKGPELFDEFEKEGKRSLAFRMIFQSNERTLSDDEVNSYMTKLYDFVKTKGWEVR